MSSVNPMVTHSDRIRPLACERSVPPAFRGATRVDRGRRRNANGCWHVSVGPPCSKQHPRHAARLASVSKIDSSHINRQLRSKTIDYQQDR